MPTELNPTLIPAEIWIKVMRLLKPKDILNLFLVHKRFKEVGEDNTLWREKVQQHFFLRLSN